jgi:hypothetical protein
MEYFLSKALQITRYVKILPGIILKIVLIYTFVNMVLTKQTLVAISTIVSNKQAGTCGISRSSVEQHLIF